MRLLHKLFDPKHGRGARVYRCGQCDEVLWRGLAEPGFLDLSYMPGIGGLNVTGRPGMVGTLAAAPERTDARDQLRRSRDQLKKSHELRQVPPKIWPGPPKDPRP
jgi:hypothetical protein